MAIVVETGAGLSDSNSYASADEADAYFTTYGNVSWAATQIDKEMFLTQASKAIDLLYGPEFLSAPCTTNQAMLFPRFPMVINRIQIIQGNVVPRQLKEATYELALQALLGVDITPQPNQDKQIEQSAVKVGDLGKSVTYRKILMGEQYTGLWKIELLLKPLLRKTDGNPTAYGF